jgi:hypothetical protein
LDSTTAGICTPAVRTQWYGRTIRHGACLALHDVGGGRGGRHAGGHTMGAAVVAHDLDRMLCSMEHLSRPAAGQSCPCAAHRIRRVRAAA